MFTVESSGRNNKISTNYTYLLTITVIVTLLHLLYDLITEPRSISWLLYLIISSIFVTVIMAEKVACMFLLSVSLIGYERPVLSDMTQHGNYAELCCHSNRVTGADRYML